MMEDILEENDLLEANAAPTYRKDLSQHDIPVQGAQEANKAPPLTQLSEAEKNLLDGWGWANPPKEAIQAVRDFMLINSGETRSGDYLVRHGVFSKDEVERLLSKKPSHLKTLEYLSGEKVAAAAYADRWNTGMTGSPYYESVSRFSIIEDFDDTVLDNLKEIRAVAFEMSKTHWGLAFGSFASLSHYLKQGRDRILSLPFYRAARSKGKAIHVCLSSGVDVSSALSRIAQRHVSGQGLSENTWNVISATLTKHDQEICNILDSAISKGVDDISLIPETDGGYRVYYRLHGELIISPVSSRIKPDMAGAIKRALMSKSGANRTNETRVPDARDGQINYRSQAGEAVIRCSFIPLNHPGDSQNLMSISLRLLILKEESISFDGLGYPKDVQAYFDQSLRMGSGLIPIGGPVNSGKSTGMAAALNRHVDLYGMRKKRLSVEYPIERLLNGVIQFMPDGDMENPEILEDLLKAFKRHDPDVITVGETRDRRTAEMAVDSAASGRLVMTTVHASDTFMALEVFARQLPEAKILQYIENLNLIVVQRLPARLCPHCSTKRPLNHDEKNQLMAYAEMKGEAIELQQIPNQISVRDEKGCSYCNHIGTDGRILLVEALPMSRQVRDLALELFLEGKNHRQAIKDARTRTILQSALEHLRSGRIALDDVFN